MSQSLPASPHDPVHGLITCMSASLHVSVTTFLTSCLLLQVMFDKKAPLWTEYSVYRTVGCLTGTFWAYHSSTKSKVAMYKGMWTSSQLGVIAELWGSSNPPLFLVAQEEAGLSLRSVGLGGYQCGIRLIRGCKACVPS